MQVPLALCSPFNTYLISKIDEKVGLFPQPQPVQLDPAAQPGQAPPAQAAAPGVRPLDFAQEMLFGDPLLAATIAINSVANLLPPVAIVPAAAPAAVQQAQQLQQVQVQVQAVQEAFLAVFPVQPLVQMTPEESEGVFEKFETLPADIQRLTSLKWNFWEWVNVRRRVKPHTVQHLDQEVIKRNKIGHRLERAFGLTTDEQIFGFFFDQFIFKATPVELERLIQFDQGDQFRPKALVLSTWERTANRIRKIFNSPLTRIPLVIWCGVLAYKVAKITVQIFNTYIIPLAYAIGEKYLPRRIFRSVNFLIDYQFRIWILGYVIEWLAPKLPAPITPYAFKIGYVMRLPSKIAGNITWCTLTLPISAFGFAVGSTYTNASLVDRALGAGMDASKAARFRDGISHARRRWVEYMASLRRPPDAAPAA